MQRCLGDVETTFFDYKEKDDPSQPKLDKPDKENLAKATSGFANTGGGLLIWGIRDEDLSPQHISDLSKFLNNAMELVHQATDPGVPGVTGVAIPSTSDKSKGFAVMMIPQSDLPPHRVALNVGKSIPGHYFIRSGNSLFTANHSQLEDMFGRRPHPKLELDYELLDYPGPVHDEEIPILVRVGIKNVGRGIAKYPYLEIEVDPPHGLYEGGIDQNGNVGLPYAYQTPKYRELVSKAEFGARDGLVLHSQASIAITHVKAVVRGDQVGTSVAPLKFRYRIDAEGAVPVEDVISAGDILLRRIAAKAMWKFGEGE